MYTEGHEFQTEVAGSLIRDHRLDTPFLFLDEQRLQTALNLFQTFLPKVRLFYAVKANPATNLIQYFYNQGLSLDVSSGGEIRLARSLQIPGDRLFLSNTFKTKDTLEAMFQHRIFAFAVDTVGELEKVASYKSLNKHIHTPKVFIRIHVESKNVEVDLNTKFGCSVSEALDLIGRSKELGFDTGGICFHVGTQSTNHDNYFLGIRSAILIATEAMRRFQVRVPVINIGGGFSDPVAAEKAGIELPRFYKSVGQACQEAIDAGFEIYAEPGRCLVSVAGTGVTSVVGTNTRRNQRWVYLDDGIYGCYSIKLYEENKFKFQVIPVSKAFRTSNVKSKWTVAGPTCDSLDVIAENVELPDDLSSGDFLLTPNLGAYTISTSSNFNGFPMPKCHLVRASVSKGKITTSILSSDVAPSEKIAANA